MVSIGTSGVFLSFEAQNVDYQGNCMFSIMQWQKQYSMGVTLAAGNSLSWYRDTFAEGVDFSELLADIGRFLPEQMVCCSPLYCW